MLFRSDTIYIKQKNWIRLDSILNVPMNFPPEDLAKIYINTAERIYLITKDASRSIQWQLKAVELVSEHIPLDTIYFNISQKYSLLNDKQKAMEYIKKAVDINPGFKKYIK